jgi:DnaJ-class molecular chaperone
MTLYEILGVSESATPAEIKQAFRARALLYHPDKNPGNEVAAKKFRQLTAAYEVLSDSLARSKYDVQLQGPRCRGCEAPVRMGEGFCASCATEMYRSDLAETIRSHKLGQDRVRKSAVGYAHVSFEGFSTDDILESLLAETVIQSAEREPARPDDDETMDIRVSPTFKVTVDKRTLKALNDVHQNLKTAERWVNSIKTFLKK